MSGLNGNSSAAANAGTSPPRVGVALVGCGYWGSNLCRVLAQHSGMDLRWICDPDPAALQRATRLAPSARLTDTLDSILADPETSVVVIATAVATHHQMAMASLQAGRHTFVEKPLARTTVEAQELVSEADARGLILMVGHTFLYNAAVRRVKSMIDAGDLGDIHYVFSRRLNLGIVRQDVDVLWNLAPHDISILHYWIGRPVKSVTAVGHSFLQPGIADVAFGHITYEGNIAGHLHVSWLDPGKVRQVTVVGSRKMLTYDDMSSDARISVFDKGIDGKGIDLPVKDPVMGDFETYAQHQLTVRAGDAWIPRVDVPEPLGQEIDELYHCVVEGRQPLADGRNGLAVVSTLEQLSQAMWREGVSPSPASRAAARQNESQPELLGSTEGGTR